MRVMGLDPGERRIGVAISDPTGTIARPLETITHRSRSKDLERIVRLVEETGAEIIVMGLPLSLNGDRGPQARWASRYAKALAEVISTPIVMWDERYSSSVAREILQNNRKRSRQHSLQKGEVDSVAAAVILQGYLDSQMQDGIDGEPPSARP